MEILKITDLQLVQKYLDKANYRGYNSNFVTMMMWNHEYHILYEEVDDALIMLLEFDHHRFFSMPFCTPESVCKCIDWMIDYAMRHNIDFRLECAVDEVRDIMYNHYGDSFMYLCNEDFSDYIYDLNMVKTLTGKKMQKRRNHYNFFCKEYPNIIYKEIEDEDIDNVYLCLKNWQEKQEDHELIDSEFIGIQTLLNNRSILPIKTGCIYINGILEAFTIASPLPHKTVQIHVEKANKDIRGLYVAINKLFLENNFEGYEYVNREEDMGLITLRKAKLSMHPVDRVKKYSIAYNDYFIKKGDSSYKNQLKDLWINSFDDEDELSTEYYFNHHFLNNDCFIVLSKEEVVSCLYLCPFKLNNQEAYYIVGVSTNKLHRHNRCMTRLFDHILNLEKYKNKTFLLMTETPEVYKSIGFEPTYYKYLSDINEIYTMDYNLIVKKPSYNELVVLYSKYVSKFERFRIRNDDYYQLLLKRLVAYNQIMTCFYDNDEIVGYCIYDQGEKITVHEIIFLDDKYLYSMIGYLQTICSNINIYTDINTKINDSSKLVPVMYTINANENSKKPLFISEIM